MPEALDSWNRLLENPWFLSDLEFIQILKFIFWKIFVKFFFIEISKFYYRGNFGIDFRMNFMSWKVIRFHFIRLNSFVAVSVVFAVVFPAVVLAVNFFLSITLILDA